MSQPAQQLAARYHLQLSDQWLDWFDRGLESVPLPGSFRSPLSVDRLLVAAPPEIWPGFMLPDTLPLVSNEYGDWICLRVLADGSCGELIHWYHGGGDWIPLGKRLAEVVVHDVVDQFRPIAHQMLRGAVESIEPRQRDQVLRAFAQPALRDWLSQHLAGDGVSTQQVAQTLEQLESSLSLGDYVSVLERLHAHGWSIDAVSCDLIQVALQRSIAPLIDPSIAKSLEMNWSPDYVRWLFDVCRVPGAARARIESLLDAPLTHWPKQDWSQAGELASEVLCRRQDLGWAVNIAGWSKQRAGDERGAAEIYFGGRLASAFSDQGVRMRTHWSEPHFGKFTIAQLSTLSQHLTVDERGDGYLAAIWRAPEKLTMACVQDFWLSEGRRKTEAKLFAEAYECFYRAGWDIGVQRLSEYQRILERLVDSARAAGWPARAAVAETHLACLVNRFG